MRNFYTVLDYDDDLIAIGVNKGSAGLAKAEIEGHRDNPKLQKHQNLLGAFFLVLLVVFIIVGVISLVLWRRDIIKKKKKQGEGEGRVGAEGVADKEEKDKEDETKEATDLSDKLLESDQNEEEEAREEKVGAIYKIQDESVDEGDED